MMLSSQMIAIIDKHLNCWRKNPKKNLEGLNSMIENWSPQTNTRRRYDPPPRQTQGGSPLSSRPLLMSFLTPGRIPSRNLFAKKPAFSCENFTNKTTNIILWSELQCVKCMSGLRTLEKNLKFSFPFCAFSSKTREIWTNYRRKQYFANQLISGIVLQYRRKFPLSYFF